MCQITKHLLHEHTPNVKFMKYKFSLQKLKKYVSPLCIISYTVLILLILYNISRFSKFVCCCYILFRLLFINSKNKASIRRISGKLIINSTSECFEASD